MSQVDPIIPSEQQAIFALGAFAGLSSSVTGKLIVGGELVDAPAGPSDPRGAEIVAQVAAELLKHGAPSGATGRG